MLERLAVRSLAALQTDETGDELETVLDPVLQIVQQDVSGMRLNYGFPLAIAAMMVPIMLSAAMVAAIWPAEAAVRGSLVEALEYD